MKTNAARTLDQLGIRYELREYSAGSEEETAVDVAARIGLPPEQVFKTLVARGDRHGVCLAVIPADCELDLKALAHVSGDKRVELVPLKEVLPLTGYVRGGVTVLGCSKNYPAYTHETIGRWERISVSAGRRGMQILLSPCDYLRATKAVIADIAHEKA